MWRMLKIVLVICLLGTLFAFDTYIPAPKVNALQSDTVPTTAMQSVQTLLPFPEDISYTLNITITDESDSCLTIPETNTLHQGSQFRFDGVFKSPDAYIMAVSYASNQIFGLLSDGVIFTSDFEIKPDPTFLVNKSFVYSASKSNMPWKNIQWQLFNESKALYIFGDGHIYEVVFDTYNPKQPVWYSRKLKIENILKVVKHSKNLLLMQHNKVIQLSNSLPTWFQCSAPECSFIDVASHINDIYILDRGGVIHTLNTVTHKLSSIDIEQGQYAKKIAVWGNTIFLHYHFHLQDYIAELFLLDGYAHLNKFYHNYDRIKNIHFFGPYALLDTYDSLLVVKHSINRHAIMDDVDNEFVGRKFIPKLVGIQPLKTQHMSFILIERTKITAVRVFADDDKLLQIRNKVIACSFKENKTYNVTAVYRGVCNSQGNYNLVDYVNFCELKRTFLVEVDSDLSRRESQAMFRRMLMIGGWVLLLICLGILFLVFKKQLINLKNRLEEKRVRGEGQHRLVEMKSADMVIS